MTRSSEVARKELEPRGHGGGGEEDAERQPAHRDAAAELDARGLEALRAEGARVRREDFQEEVLDDDREAEGHQQRREDVAPERAIQKRTLEHIAQYRHRGHHHGERGVGAPAGAQHQRYATKGGEHDEIAVRDIDQPHDAEGQRQSHGEERVETAQEHALHERVKPADQVRRRNRHG
jgi:hypothetical protein